MIDCVDKRFSRGVSATSIQKTRHMDSIIVHAPHVADFINGIDPERTFGSSLELREAERGSPNYFPATDSGIEMVT